MDGLTGLVWLRNANVGESLLTWQEALDHVVHMNRDQAAGYADWRQAVVALPKRRILKLPTRIRVEPDSLMQEERNSPLRPKTFGLLLGTITIDGMSIPLYSNGDSLYVSDQKTYDKKGRYLALAYHCVEFVRRYIYEKYDLNLARCWREGDADDWYANRATMPLRSISRSECRPGDIITFTGEKTGHIAIVKEVREETIVIASQNLTNTKNDLHTTLDSEILSGKKPLVGQNDFSFFFESAMQVTL